MAKNHQPRRPDLSAQIDPPRMSASLTIDEQELPKTDGPATPDVPQDPPVSREVVARAVHLLCRAGSSLPPNHLLRPRLERMLATLVDRPELARMVCAPLELLTSALSLDPHQEAAARDVRAALDVL